jgi:hypothetical protein
MKKLKEYLSGQMNEEQLSDFTEVLVQHKFDQEKRKAWSHILKEQHGLERSGSSSSKRKKLPLAKIIGIAASFALLIGLSYIIMTPATPEYQRLSQEYIQTLPIMGDPSVIRKDAIDEEVLRLKANEAFVDENFEAAVKSWEALVDNDMANTNDYFYLGISHLRKAKADPAACIKYLTLVQQSSSSFRQEANWVLSLAYIKSDDIDKARPILEQIVQNKEYMAEKAEALLRALPVE